MFSVIASVAVLLLSVSGSDSAHLRCSPVEVCPPWISGNENSTMGEIILANLQRDGPEDGICLQDTKWIYQGAELGLPNRCACLPFPTGAGMCSMLILISFADSTNFLRHSTRTRPRMRWRRSQLQLNDCERTYDFKLWPFEPYCACWRLVPCWNTEIHFLGCCCRSPYWCLHLHDTIRLPIQCLLSFESFSINFITLKASQCLIYMWKQLTRFRWLNFMLIQCARCVLHCTSGVLVWKYYKYLRLHHSTRRTFWTIPYPK